MKEENLPNLKGNQSTKKSLEYQINKTGMEICTDI